MKVWLLQFVRWPGYDAEPETVGVFSSEEKAINACPYKDELKPAGKPYGPEKIVDPKGDHWFVYEVEIDAPIQATYPTWEDD